MLAILLAAQICTFDQASGKIGPGAQPKAELAASMELSQGDGSFTVDGDTYAKSGAPMEMAAFEIQAFEAFGAKGTVPIFDAATGDESVSYVLVKSDGCIFQHYARG